MKTKGYTTFTLILAVVLSLHVTTSTAEIERVRFNEVFESEGMRLPLQGTGLFRYMGFFKAQLLGVR